MTTDKTFKRRVRERMATTGERYTTARRALLSDRAPTASPMPLGGVHPETAGLRALLGAAGVRDPRSERPLSEALLLLVGGGLGMGVFAFHYPEFSSLFLAGRHRWHAPRDWLDAAAARLGAAPRVWETGSAGAARRHLDEALAAGPALAFVDLGTLEGRAGVEAYHLVVVHAVDEEGAVAYADVGTAVHRASAERFAAARARIKKDRHRLWSLEGAPPVEAAALAAAVRTGLRAWPEALEDPGMGPASANFRLDALATLADRVAGRGGKASWDGVFPAGERLLVALTGLHEGVLHRFTGGGLLRPLAASGLREAADLLERPELEEVADRYDALGSVWDALAEAVLPHEVPELAAWAGVLEARWARVDEPAEVADDAGDPEADPHRDGAARAAAVARLAGDPSLVGRIRADLEAHLRRVHADEVAALANLERALA